jgi:hypothetical protein
MTSITSGIDIIYDLGVAAVGGAAGALALLGGLWLIERLRTGKWFS